MAQFGSKHSCGPMASPWRRRRMCVLSAERPAPAALVEVSGRGAVIRSNLVPEQGSTVSLRHPVSGEIDAKVASVREDGIELSFDVGEDSVAFALGAVAADMSLKS